MPAHSLGCCWMLEAWGVTRDSVHPLARQAQEQQIQGTHLPVAVFPARTALIIIVQESPAGRGRPHARRRH